MKKGWKELYRESVRDITALKQAVPLREEEIGELEAIINCYPICVNSYYLGLINPMDENDPIRKMCIPDVHEFSEGGQTDTSGEAENTVIQGLQHKYRQTALILSTSQCAMYCRHCFRKRMVGASSEEVAKQLPVMADYVRSHKEINNVLISGGDAFMNSNEMIERYLQHFCAIPTLDFIRFGTRTPVVLPQRITQDEELRDILERYSKKKQILIVTQYNHPRELTPESVKAIRQLRELGCIVRNQTVLLKGVNDDSQVLADLMNGLVSHGVIPYYIFQCRPVEGVKNQFQVPFVRGIEYVEEAKRHMNGQAKNVRFVMSHPTGKIEILGKTQEGCMLFKYHQAKHQEDHARMFTAEVLPGQCWLSDDLR